MEDELWNGLCPIVAAEAQRAPRKSRVQFSDAVIILVLLWAVLHDRPISWACRRKNWPKDCLWERLPSGPTMSRRLRRLSVRMLMESILDALRDPQPCLCRQMDSKPLPVGGFSKDKDARRGYATGGIARGYKLYCIWGRGVIPDVWRLDPLNRSDPAIASDLIERLDGTGYLLADAAHEGNPLSEQAARCGFQLVSPRKKPGTPLGHSRQAPSRLRSIQLTEGPGQFGRSLYKDREAIEREFGQMTSFGGGLQPLPSWVRRPHRVALWVAAKLAINGVRILRHRNISLANTPTKQRLAA